MKVKLTDIELYEGTQVRQSSNQETVTDYAERMLANDEFPPIVIFTDGTTNYLADGFHRVLASERCKFIDIEADVRNGTKQDALWYALGANKANALRMTPGDLRKAVALALQTWPDKTQQAIADQVGVHQSTVQRVKDDIMQVHNTEFPETRTDAIGRTRPTTYQKKDTLEDIEPEPETQQEDMPDETGEEEMKSLRSKDGKKRPIGKTATACGILYARIAIVKLNEIPHGDTEIEQVKTMLKGWIDEH